MKEYEAFFFDVDGTLLDNQTHTVPKSTLQSIQKLKQLGKKVIICSGRGFIALKSIEELNFVDWDGYILYNGALTTDANGQTLDKHTFNKEVLEKIEAVSQQNKVVLLYEGDYYWFNQSQNEKSVAGMQFFGKHDDFPIEPYTNQDVCMIMAFDDSFEAFQSIDGLDVLATKHHYADIVQSGISKANGIEVLLDYFNIPIEKTMGFGDGINDLEMLQKVDTSIAMGQGIEQIKQISTYVTTAVDEDGIEHALKHFHCI